MAVTRKIFKPSFVYTYQQSNGAYSNSNSPVKTAGGSGYHSIIGFPSSVNTAIKESKTTAKVFVKWRVTNTGTVAFGAHKKATNDKQTRIYYGYLGVQRTASAGWVEQQIDNLSISGTSYSFKTGLLNYGYKGVVLYGLSGQDYMEGYGLTNDSNCFQIIVEGTFADVPTQPTNLSPNQSDVINGTVSGRLTWKHNGVGDASSQNGYRVRYRKKGGSWTYIPSSTGFSNSTYLYHSYAANTFTDGVYEWGVVTRASNGQISPEALSSFSVANIINAPTITSPVSGSVLTKDVLEVRWVPNATQSWVDVIVTDSQGVQVDRYTASTSVARYIGIGKIVTAETYTITVQIKDDKGNPSELATTVVTTSFVAPKKPTIDSVTTTDGTQHEITYTSEDLDEEGQPLTIYEVRFYSKPTSSVDDYQFVEVIRPGVSMYYENLRFGSGQEMNYLIEAVGENGTSSFSDPYIFSSEFEGSYLHADDDFSDSVSFNIVRDRQEEYRVETELMNFIGRKWVVPEFGSKEESIVSINCIVDTQIELETLKKLWRQRKKLYYRDSYGRAFSCSMSNPIKLKDKLVGGYDVDVELVRVE